MQINMNEWHQRTEKYPDIKINQAGFDIPQWQKTKF